MESQEFVLHDRPPTSTEAEATSETQPAHRAASQFRLPCPSLCDQLQAAIRDSIACGRSKDSIARDAYMGGGSGGGRITQILNGQRNFRLDTAQRVIESLGLCVVLTHPCGVESFPFGES